MALRILTGCLIPKERNGVATISFNPHGVTGDADGSELRATGASGDFDSRRGNPGKVVSMREFRVQDRRKESEDSSQYDWFRITDNNLTAHNMEVEWSCESGAWIKEISYLIVGET